MSHPYKFDSCPERTGFGSLKWDKYKGRDVLPLWVCLLYTSPSPRDRQKSRMPSSA